MKNNKDAIDKLHDITTDMANICKENKTEIDNCSVGIIGVVISEDKHNNYIMSRSVYGNTYMIATMIADIISDYPGMQQAFAHALIARERIRRSEIDKDNKEIMDHISNIINQKR
jgi:hypothetical protein